MAETMCPTLYRLSLILRNTYRLRDKSRGNKGAFELDLLHVNNLITQHRFSCRCCQFNEAPPQDLPTYSNPRSKVVSIDSQVHTQEESALLRWLNHGQACQETSSRKISRSCPTSATKSPSRAFRPFSRLSMYSATAPK